MTEEEVRKIVAEALIYGAHAILNYNPVPIPPPVEEATEISSNGVAWTWTTHTSLATS